MPAIVESRLLIALLVALESVRVVMFDAFHRLVSWRRQFLNPLASLIQVDRSPAP
jgi:hypothetical protein